MLALYLVVVRYLVVLAMGALVHRGLIEALPGTDVTDAVSQIVMGLAVAAAMAAWALLRSTRKAVLARVAAMHEVSTIHASPELATTMRARGVANVVPTPPVSP